MNTAYTQLTESVTAVKPGYCDDSTGWKGSPFEWIKGGIASRRKGTIGEEIVTRLLEKNGFIVDHSPDSEADIVIDGTRMEVKLSTLWAGGQYTFQQIRDQNYELLFCLGLSPNVAHAWVIRKTDIAWDDLPHQHGGQSGRDTWWLSFDPPNAPHAWMAPANGDVSEACKHLRTIIT